MDIMVEYKVECDTRQQLGERFCSVGHRDQKQQHEIE